MLFSGIDTKDNDWKYREYWNNGKINLIEQKRLFAWFFFSKRHVRALRVEIVLEQVLQSCDFEGKKSHEFYLELPLWQVAAFTTQLAYWSIRECYQNELLLL